MIFNAWYAGYTVVGLGGKIITVNCAVNTKSFQKRENNFEPLHSQ